MLVIDTALSYLTGNRLLSAYSKSFGNAEAKTICRLSAESVISPDTILAYKPIVAEMLQKKDQGSLKIVLQSFDDGEQAAEAVLLDDSRYDISIINADIPIGIIENMAMKTVKEKKPLRLLFIGPSYAIYNATWPQRTAMNLIHLTNFRRFRNF